MLMEFSYICRMIKRTILLAVLLAASIDASQAAKWNWPFGKKKAAAPASTAQTAPAKTSEYERFLKEKPKTEFGMVLVHKSKEKLYLEIPVKLLGRDMLLGSVVSETSDNSRAIVGSQPNAPMHVRFLKNENRIALTSVASANITDSPDVEKAIARSNADAVLQSFKIEMWNLDSTAVVIDVTDFFVGDQKRMGPFPFAPQGSVRRIENFRSDRSFLVGFKAFASNISVKSSLSYTVTTTSGSQEISRDVPFTAVMTRSLILLDSIAQRPRITDARMSVFCTPKTLYSAQEQGTRTVWYAHRWKLEPTDTAAFRRGEPVAPKKPIVFWVDDTFPGAWKEYIEQGVLQWNELFEKIGFKNAVECKPFSPDDPKFDPDNIANSCIRYAPIKIANAMGPSWVDPRSGEILCASVYVYHDVIRLLNNWRTIQTAQVDPKVRGMELPQEVLGDGLRYVIAHEVGHCLGFMHNMGASSHIPVDSLRSASWRGGTTYSIMDYARFNYVAQPSDAGAMLTPPRFGEYDRYALDWLYTPVFGVETAAEEYKVTSAWITQAIQNPIYRYGQQQFGVNIDPASLTEDLGDDALKASRYGIDNLKYIMPKFFAWEAAGDDDYDYRQGIFAGMISQYIRYMNHVYASIGGVYLNARLQGDPVIAYQCVAGERQRMAVEFFKKELRDLAWMDEPSVVRNIAFTGVPSQAVRSSLMGAVLSFPSKVAYTFPMSSGADIYTPQMAMEDVFDIVWEPTRKGTKLQDWEMDFQREYLSAVCAKAGLSYGGSSSFGIGVADGNEHLGVRLPEQAAQRMESQEWKCSCAQCGTGHHGDAGPDGTAGSGLANGAIMRSIMFTFPDPRSYQAENYAMLIKARDLVRSRMGSAAGAVAAHYQLIIKNIEKTLE